MIQLKKPKDDQVIWQYMDFIKFVSILNNSALYFTRVDKFDDTYEGLLPYFDNLIEYIAEAVFSRVINQLHTVYNHPSLERRELYINDLAHKLVSTLSDNHIQKVDILKQLLYKVQNNEMSELKELISEEIRLSVKYSSDFLRKFTAANCWFTGDESASMWKLYSSEKSGIAIKTSFKNLYSSFTDTDQLVFSEVIYPASQDHYIKSLDRLFKKEGNFWWNIGILDITQNIIKKSINPYFLKRKCFEAEKELRILTHKQHKHCILSQDEIDSIWEERTGKYVFVDIEKLIDEVYISPKAPNWFINQVKSVINQYGYFKLTHKVKKSTLYTNPLNRF